MIRFKKIAKKQIKNLYEAIVFKYGAPLTAKKYSEGLFVSIDGLDNDTVNYRICLDKSILRKYHFQTRRKNYKKMAIIYANINDIIVILEVKPQSTITGLR